VSYSTLQQVRYALAQGAQTSGTNTAADMDDATITDAIAEADSVIDTYIGGPYDPTDVIPNTVTYWSRDIAAFLATCTWRKSKDFQVLDPVYLRYQLALTRLNGIATGVTTVPGPSPTNPDEVGATVVNPLSPGYSMFPPWNYDLLGFGAWTWGWAVWDQWRSPVWPGYPGATQVAQ